MDSNNLITTLPKAELHCHLDGSVRPETILELSLKNNIKIPASNLEEFRPYFQITGECSSLKEYLDKFYFPLKIMQTKEDLYRITLELLEDAQKDGIRYIEIRFAPFLHTDKGLAVETVIETVLDAMKTAEKKYNIFSGLILCCLRHESYKKSIEVVNLAHKYSKHGVTAVDLAGNESDFPPELHQIAFDLAYKYGLNITIHAGETGISENILKSINLLHAVRIGHGIFAYKDKKLLEFLIEHQTPLEMCPKSNLDTKAIAKYKDHPIKSYLEMGINVTLNTDNRTVSNVTLVEEYSNLMNIFQMNLDQVLQIMKNGINSSFASTQIKASILNELNEKLSQI